MAQVCTAPEFTHVGGELELSVLGTFRPVAKTRQTAVNDGPFGSLPLPGRVHVEIEVTWVNDTGMPMFVYGQAERGPWSITIANPNFAVFRDRLTFASGVGARAATPDISTVFDGEFCSNIHADDCFFCFPQAVEQAATSYGSQDVGRFETGFAVAQPGDTASARYRCSFATSTPFVSVLGPPNYDARARYGIARIYAAPARTQ